MLRYLFFLPIIFIALSASAQTSYTAAAVFSHNDYAQAIPFLNAYQNQVGFIEADVFLRDNALLVAHTEKEIDKNKTLQKLYLDPLKEKIATHEGFVYPDHERTLTLMID